MDIGKSHYYSLVRSLMSFVGLWPYQNQMLKFGMRCFMILAMDSTYFPEIIKIVEVRGDYNYMLKCLPAILFNSICILKYLCVIVMEDKIRLILDKIQSDWLLFKENHDELQILHKLTDDARKLNLIYAVYMFVGGLGAFTMLPLTPQLLDLVSPLNESRPVRFMTEGEYFVDPYEHYYSILAHNIIVGTLVVVVFVAFDTTFVSVVQHSCTLFIIASERLRYAYDTGKGYSEFASTIKDSCEGTDVRHGNLIEFVVLHNRALEFAHNVESAYSAINLFILGYAVLSLAATGIQTISNVEDIDEMMRFGLYAFGSIFHLFCYNWLGQRLTNHSNLIYDSACSCLWYEGRISSRSKLLLRIIMQRSLSSYRLTAGKTYELSYANFTSVMKISMSYFTVLRSVQ